MAVTDRKRQLRIAAEILQVHLPAALHDQNLARDQLSVAGMALREAYEDALRSADVWDRKHYHLRADRLREEWTWALAAANMAEGLAYRDAPVTEHHLNRLHMLTRPQLGSPGRRIIKNVENLRGAAQANRRRRTNTKKHSR